jgi:hypothetical protein
MRGLNGIFGEHLAEPFAALLDLRGTYFARLAAGLREMIGGVNERGVLRIVVARQMRVGGAVIKIGRARYARYAGNPVNDSGSAGVSIGLRSSSNSLAPSGAPMKEVVGKDGASTSVAFTGLDGASVTGVTSRGSSEDSIERARRRAALSLGRVLINPLARGDES